MKHNIKTVAFISLLIATCVTFMLIKKYFFTEKTDNFLIVKNSIEHLFDKKVVSPFFYKKPIIFKESPWLKEINKGLINGHPYTLVKEIPSPNKRDWLNPLPYVEILNIIEIDKDNIEVKILFTSTGSLFNVNLYKKGDKWEVNKFDESKI